MPERSELHRDLQTGTRHTLHLLESLSPAEWEIPTRAGEWHVRDVAAHLLEVDEKIAQALGRGAAWSRTSADLLPERYRSSGEWLLHALEELAEEDLNALVEVRNLGQLPAAVALRLRVFEQFHHTSDMLAALGRPVQHLPELLAPAFRFVRLAVPWLIARERIVGVHLRYGFRFDEIALGAWRLVLSGGEARVEAWQGGRTDAEILGDPVCFLLDLVLRKGDPGRALLSRRARIRGDHAACVRLHTFLPLLD